MKRQMALALMALAAISARAEIFGVRLVSAVEHPMVQGQGLNTSAVGVVDGGQISSEIFDVAKTQGAYATSLGSTSSASDYFTITLHVFWLQRSSTDTPPGTLYLNQIFGGSGSSTSTSEASGTSPASTNGHTTDSVSNGCLSSIPKNIPASNAQCGGGNPGTATPPSTGSATFFKKQSTSLSVTWTFVGYINGLALYRTDPPVSFDTPTTSAYGTGVASGYPGGYVRTHGMSSVGLGMSHRIAVIALGPPSNGGGGSNPPSSGGGGGGTTTPPTGGGGGTTTGGGGTATGGSR